MSAQEESPGFSRGEDVNTPAPGRVGASKALTGLLEALKECLASQLAHTDRPVCHLPIIWGDSPLPAQRCDCTCANAGHGEAWVRLIQAAPVDLFSATGNSPGSGYPKAGCAGSSWEYSLELGVWRCALTLDDAGTPPSDEDYQAHTQGMLADVAALQRTWGCCTWLTDRDWPHVLDSVVPSGPSGGCVGVIASGRVRVDRCITCP